MSSVREFQLSTTLGERCLRIDNKLIKKLQDNDSKYAMLVNS